MALYVLSGDQIVEDGSQVPRVSGEGDAGPAICGTTSPRFYLILPPAWQRRWVPSSVDGQGLAWEVGKSVLFSPNPWNREAHPILDGKAASTLPPCTHPPAESHPPFC